MTQPPNDRERIVERDRTTHTTTTERSGSTGIAMIVGGLLVAVVVLYFLFAGFDTDEVGEGVSETNVTVESTETTTETAPAAEPEVEIEVQEVEPETEAAPATEGDAEPAEPAEPAETQNN